jgi:hypothetical protein
MRRIEWTWVKGHSGYLLNECADVFATKGVNNEQPPSNAQFAHPISEDTDSEVYEFREVEDSNVGASLNGDYIPEKTHVMKGTEDQSPPIAPSVEQPESLPNPWTVVIEQSDSPEIPHEDDDDEGRVEAGTVRFHVESPAPTPLAKPDWWTAAWQKLEQSPSPRHAFQKLQPMAPALFRTEAGTNVDAIDL